MKKLISIFAVVLVLVFSCVPAFAEGQVVNGYAVDNVPYSSLFDGVLTSSEEGSQIYSSSSNKTYKTKDVLSAPATNSNTVYYYKSITNFIPLNLWRGSGSPNISTLDKDGYTGLNYVWPDSTANSETGKTFYHQNEQARFTKLRAGRKYRISFDTTFNLFSGEFSFYLANENTPNEVFLPLLNLRGYNTSYHFNSSYTVEFTVPEGNVILIPIVKGLLSRSGAGYSGTQIVFRINDFTITDITTEDLDNSIDKGVQKIENAGSDEPPLDTDISAFQSAIDTMNGWLVQLNEFADTIDTAGDTAKDYISKGTELFNGFMGVAPASVLALISFGIVFLVIRKIVGR